MQQRPAAIAQPVLAIADQLLAPVRQRLATGSQAGEAGPAQAGGTGSVKHDALFAAGEALLVQRAGIQTRLLIAPVILELGA